MRSRDELRVGEVAARVAEGLPVIGVEVDGAVVDAGADVLCLQCGEHLVASEREAVRVGDQA